MADTALRVFRAGHLPVLGEWLALPLSEHAGSQRVGDALVDEIFHPRARRLVQRCDACWRMGGPARGADEMVALARAAGRRMFMDFDQLPRWINPNSPARVDGVIN